MIGIAEANDNEATLPGLPEQDDDLIQEITQNLRDARKHWSEWRNDAREDYDFYAGNQWSEDDAAKLREENRPAVVFNRCVRSINALIGLEVQNRQEVRYLPRRTDVNGFSEKLSDTAKWVRDNCDAEDEESEAFQDASICGIGWTDTIIDYEEDEEGQIKVHRLDPLEVLVDHNAKKRNFVDAKWIAHIKEVTKKELKQLLPDVDDITISSFWNDTESSPHNAADAWLYENDQTDRLQKPDTIALVRYQYYERDVVYSVISETGQIIKLKKDKFEKLRPYIEANGLRYVQQPMRIYKQCILIGNKIYQQSELGCHFTLKAITGLRDRNKNTWFGLIRIMKDPARWSNKWLSQIQHIINSNAKGGLYAEWGAFHNRRKAEDDFAKPNAIIDLNPGAISGNKILTREPPRYPEGVDRLMQYALEAINDVTGINLEMLGMANRDQANLLENTRKQAGITILATFFDALRRYRKEQGRILAYFIREYIADGRLVRVLGQEGAQYVPLIKDEVAFKYDIIVDDAPTSPNMKEKVFNIFMQALPLLIQAGIPVPPDVIDYLPLPESLGAAWKKMIAGQTEDPLAAQMKQMQLMLSQLELEDKQADVLKKHKELEEKDSTIAKNYAQATQAQAIGQDESAQAMQKLGLMNQEHMMKRDALDREQERKDLEMWLNHGRKMLETRLNARIKSQQASARPVQ